LDKLTVTTAAGVPVADNRNSTTAATQGPILLQDVHPLEKLQRFNRERIPERVVHAKGSGAHGYFIVTADVTKVWSHKRYPLEEVGEKVLDRNPEHFFADVEPAAFSPGKHPTGHGRVAGQDAAGTALCLPRCASVSHRHQLPAVAGQSLALTCPRLPARRLDAFRRQRRQRAACAGRDPARAGRAAALPAVSRHA